MAADIKHTYAADVDLNAGAHFATIPKLIQGESGATVISLTCKRGSAAADITGATCYGLVLNAANEENIIAGSVAGNVASFTLDASSGAMVGRLKVILFLQLGGATKPIFHGTTAVVPGET